MIKFNNLEQVKELMCDAAGNFNSNHKSVELFTNKSGKQIYVGASFCTDENKHYENLMKTLDNDYQEDYLIYLESEVDLVLIHSRIEKDIDDRKELFKDMARSFADNYEAGLYQNWKLVCNM